jgi:hypothetical protein
MILLISASQEAGIIGMHHHCNPILIFLTVATKLGDNWCAFRGKSDNGDSVLKNMINHSRTNNLGTQGFRVKRKSFQKTVTLQLDLPFLCCNNIHV